MGFLVSCFLGVVFLEEVAASVPENTNSDIAIKNKFFMP
jgi:hypothetical protein